MKLLAVSLMRLGDLLQLAPLLKSYQEQKKVRISILMYKEFAIAKQLMPFIDEWIYIDRKNIQERAKNRYVPVMDSLTEIDTVVNQVEKAGFSKILCFSHNKISHLFCDILKDSIPDQIGSFHTNDEGGLPWLRYLNEVASVEGASSLHIVDIYKKMLGIDLKTNWIEAYELNYNINVDLPKEDYICVQISSSEDKKSLSVEDWVESFLHFRMLNPKIKIVCLFAPSESESLDRLSQRSSSAKLKNIECISCDLKSAMALIHGSKLFITPDTSIKYLAYGSNTKLIELSLGSSQFRQTGSYLEDSLIVQSNIPCAPCSHSSECPHASFLCHQKIAGSFLGFVMFHYMESNRAAMDLIADEFFDQVQLYSTSIRSNSLWFASRLGMLGSQNNIEALLAQSAWSIVLQEKPMDEDWRSFEKEAGSIRQMLSSQASSGITDLCKSVEKMEASLLGSELEVQNFKRKLKNRSEGGDYDIELINEMKLWFKRLVQSIGSTRLYQSQFKEIFESEVESNEEVQFVKTNNLLENMKHFIRIERKLSEIIRTDFKG